MTGQERWEENAAFIAHARADVLRLLAEIARLWARRTPPPPGAADVLRSRR